MSPREYTPAARVVALVLSLAVLHPRAVLAQVTLGSGAGGTFNGGNVTGATTFLDGTNFSINNTADPTKQIQFSAASITTGTARTYTMPNVSSTVCVAGLDCAPTVAWTFTSANLTVGTAGTSNLIVNSDASLSVGGNLFFSNRTAMTPDAPVMLTNTTSNMVHVFELGDASSNLGNCAAGAVAATDPGLCSHSAVADTTQYNHMSAFGFARKSVKTLTESAATSTVRIPVAASTGTGGTFHYCVFAADATDQQQRCGRIKFSVTNKAATETCGLNTDAAVTNDASITETEDGNAASISSGTLTYAITCDLTPANAVDIQINAVSSLTQSTLIANWSVDLIGPGEPLRQ